MSLLKTLSGDFRRLFLNDTPFLDVRAPVEYAKGTFPTAANFPLLNTQEREQVGLCYKNHGQDEAVKLGYQLISGETKDRRISQWCDFVRSHPSAQLYCWRGGMRSNLTQHALRDAGFDVPLVSGGYKALRRELITVLDETAVTAKLIIIAGKTGTHKTGLIRQLATGVDLEGLAHHRGSSFGRRPKQPPCQVDFENSLAIDVLKRRDLHVASPLFFEDESHMVGPVTVPLSLWQAMTQSERVVIEMPMAYRVARILEDYVVGMAAEYLALDPDNGFDHYRQYLLASLSRIQKRLGGLRYQRLNTMLSAAIDQQERSGDVDEFEPCIVQLLEHYYDPMYDYQMQKMQSQVVFTGDFDEVLHWAQEKVTSCL
jgi:tRNA 2-selenouridine synthase